MSENWQTHKLGELCEVLDSKRKPITKRNRVSGEYPYYGATGILDYVADYIFDEKLILIGEDGAKWGSGENSAFSAEGQYWVNNHAHVIRPDRNKVLDEWLIYHLNHSDLSEYITGLTVPKLNQAKMRDISLPVPPLPEQRRIVAILDEAFEGIATATANAEKNLANAREVFESYLNSVFTKKGDGWKEASLGTMYDVRDGTHDSPKYQPSGYPLITSKNLKRDGIDFSNVKLISEEDYQKINVRSLVHKGDVLFAMIGTIGNPTIVDSAPNFAIKNVALIKVGDDQSGRFLKYYLESQLVVSKMTSEAKGATQKFVGLGYLRAFPISLPQLDEQREVASYLDKLSNEVTSLENIYQQKLTALDDLKKSMLNKAFNGELRLI